MKTNANTNTNIETSAVSAEDKAAMHIFVIPSIVAVIFVLIGSKLWLAASISYIVLMVLYFNVKAMVVSSESTTEDKNQVNDFVGKGITLIMGIVLAILVLGIN